MTEQQFRAVYPLISGWIRQTLAEHASAARPVASLGFKRLPHYYDEPMLTSTKVVFVPKVPVPPLSAMGLDRSEEHTSELQSLTRLVCRLLLEKKPPWPPDGRA